MRRASRDDVMKQRVEICCVVDGLHSPVGCPQSKAGLCGRRYVCGFWFNSTPLNREDNHALEHHVGIVYRIPAKKEHDQHRSNEKKKLTYNYTMF